MASVNEHMTSGRAWSQRSQVPQGFVKEVSNAINVAAVSEEQKRAYEMPGALDWLKSKDIELDIDDDVSVTLMWMMLLSTVSRKLTVLCQSRASRILLLNQGKESNEESTQELCQPDKVVRPNGACPFGMTVTGTVHCTDLPQCGEVFEL